MASLHLLSRQQFVAGVGERLGDLMGNDIITAAMTTSIIVRTKLQLLCGVAYITLQRGEYATSDKVRPLVQNTDCGT